MLTVVHDRDVYVDGFDKGVESRQPEIDALNATIADKDATIADMSTTMASKDNQLNRLTQLLAKHGINPDEA